MLGNQTTSRLAIKLALPTTIIIAVVLIINGFFTSQSSLNKLKTEADKERQLKVAALAASLHTARHLMIERLSEAAQRVRENSGETGEKKFVISAAVVPLGERSVPDLRLGETSLVGNNNLVDELSQRTGALVGIYARDGDEFVSIAENLARSNNERGIGTVIKSDSLPAGELRAGKVSYGTDYWGTDKANGTPVMRAFEPIRQNGRVIGAWLIAFPITNFKDINKSIAEERILTGGFLTLVDSRGNAVAKSNTTPDDVLAKAIADDAPDSAPRAIDNFNVARTRVDGWDYTIVSGVLADDPEISTEIARTQIWTLMLAFVMAIFIGIVVILISLRITSRLEDAVDVAEKLASGDLNVDLKVTSNDEVGRLQQSMVKLTDYMRETAEQADNIAAGNLSFKVQPRSKQDRFGIALKNMLEKLLKLVQSQDERDQLQRSIMKLLDEVADVAEGDLTGQAEVTSDATGAIADAFNYMIDELRTVVHRVKDTAQAVGDSTGDIRATTDKLAEGSAAQARQIAATSLAVEEITHSIQEVSTSAQRSAEVADQSLLTAQNGAKAVNNNIAAMTRIRSQVQDTAKRIKRLGERSQEIGEIVQIIDELADRTSLLALNASLQAAAAGDAGRGFATVAEEVERLAERSTQATQRISGLTKTIQLETKDVVASMEDTIHEVVNGSQLANEAGQALQEIELVTGHLAALIQNISQTSRRQASGSENIAKSMSDISRVTELVASESKTTANSVKNLVALSDKLRGSVATFKLPENQAADDDINHYTNGKNGKIVLTDDDFPADFDLPAGFGKHEITLN